MAPIDDPEIWRTMLENLPAGVCVLDPQKTIVLWSAGAERMTGHLRHEVIGHSCIAEPLVHCDQPGCEFCDEHCPAAQSMKTSQSVDTRGFLRHKDGHEVAVRIRAIPVRNRHGSVIGALETFDELQPGREASAVTPDSWILRPAYSIPPSCKPIFKSLCNHWLPSRLHDGFCCCRSSAWPTSARAWGGSRHHLFFVSSRARWRAFSGAAISLGVGAMTSSCSLWTDRERNQSTCLPSGSAAWWPPKPSSGGESAAPCPFGLPQLSHSQATHCQAYCSA